MNPEGRVTDTLPLFPLSQGLMPDGMLHLQIFEVRYLDLIKRCHAQQLPFGVAWLQKGSEVQVPGEVPSLHAYGCVAHIRQMDKVQANFYRVVCQGGLRFQVHEVLPVHWVFGKAKSVICPKTLKWPSPSDFNLWQTAWAK